MKFRKYMLIAGVISEIIENIFDIIIANIRPVIVVSDLQLLMDFKYVHIPLQKYRDLDL